MKAVTSFRYSHWGHISKYATRKNRLVLKRITPFLLMSLFLTFLLIYSVVAGTETTIATKLLLYPFLLINIVFADFALWNYFAARKIWVIWALECFTSAMLVYWLL